MLPVGSIYIAIVNTDPAVSLGYGTWEAFATGRVLIGVDPTDPMFDAAEKTGGSKTVTLDATQIPAHSHPVVDPGHTHVQNAHTHVQNPHNHLTQRYPTATGASSGFTIDTSMSGVLADNTLPVKDATAVNQNATAVNQSSQAGISVGNTGGGSAHSNVQPSIAVFMFKRVA